MPFHSPADLPKDLQRILPSHAQDIYVETFNAAWKEYDQPEERKFDRSREETAHAVAWAAVKKQYEKNPTTQRWQRK